MMLAYHLRVRMLCFRYFVSFRLPRAMPSSPKREPDKWLIKWGLCHVNKWKLLLIRASTTHLKCQLFDICRLSFCKVTGDGCASLASALRSDHCSLKELDLSFNHLTDEGVKLLTEIQKDSQCSLERLKYAQTGFLTETLPPLFLD